MYLTTRVVTRHGATPGCSGCVGLGPHTEACRVRLEKALADERADPVEAPPGPNTQPATESQERAPAAQQEPASSSSGPAAPMPTQNLQNELMDSPKELGAQERRERKGARPSETPTSEISERPAVKARPASPPMIVPMANSRPRRGCVAVRGNRSVHDRDPDAGQSRNQLRFVDYEDPSATEAIEANDARTGEKLDSEEVRKGRTKEVRELDEFEVKMESTNQGMRVTPGKLQAQASKRVDDHRCV